MRRALDHGRDDAERSFRITCATALLHARARAAAALAGADVVDDEHHRDELVEVARAGVRGALRGDAGAVFVDTLLGPPWPDGMALAPTVIAAVDDARAWAALARSWLSLREAFDEGCAVRPRALAGLSELPAVDVDDEGTFWRQLLDEAL
jgi:hypothetical protein